MGVVFDEVLDSKVGKLIPIGIPNKKNINASFDVNIIFLNY
jgi:hypothetical protein